MSSNFFIYLHVTSQEPFEKVSDKQNQLASPIKKSPLKRRYQTRTVSSPKPATTTKLQFKHLSSTVSPDIEKLTTVVTSEKSKLEIVDVYAALHIHSCLMQEV